MMGVIEAFSPSYAKARIKFLEAAATAGLQMASFNHPLHGVEGEILALDTAKLEPRVDLPVDKLLVISSASHGLDGYSGSGVQIFALHDAEFMAKARESCVSVLYLHALDPHGFSHNKLSSHVDVESKKWCEQTFNTVVKKHIATAKQVVWLDVSASNGLKTKVNDALVTTSAGTKCQFVTIDIIPTSSPAWEGQTISMARQTLFKALHGFNSTV